MEFCAGGDLAGYIHRCKRVPEVTACAVMRQLGAGLKELWSRHMVHVCSTWTPAGLEAVWPACSTCCELLVTCIVK